MDHSTGQQDLGPVLIRKCSLAKSEMRQRHAELPPESTAEQLMA